MIGTLGELAAMPGMPSEPTLRKLIDAHKDFPVVSRGKNGVGYEIDLTVAAQWIIALRQREADEARARSDEIRQLGLDLLGPDAVAPPAEGLTASERKALIEEEFAATKLAVLRGDLVRRGEVEVAIGSFVNLVAEQSETLPQRLVRRCGAIPRETLAALEEILRADRSVVADRMADIVMSEESDLVDAAVESGTGSADTVI